MKMWIFRVIGAAVISGVSMSIVPKGSVKKILSLLCGFLMIYAFMSIGTDLDYSGLSMAMAEYRNESEEFTENAKETADNMNRRIIEEKLSAYILDKGKLEGAENLDAKVNLKWSSDGYWYPYSAVLYFTGSDAVKERLENYIEGELGIREENIEWCTYDEKQGSN